MARHAGSDPYNTGVPTDWDPLVDPWPASTPHEATPLERTVRNEVDPLGLSYSTQAWTLISDATDLATSATEVAELEIRVTQPPPAPEIVVAPRDPRREARRAAQAAIETQPVELDLGEHPSGPLPRAGTWPPVGGVPESPAALPLEHIHPSGRLNIRVPRLEPEGSKGRLT